MKSTVFALVILFCFATNRYVQARGVALVQNDSTLTAIYSVSDSRVSFKYCMDKFYRFEDCYKSKLKERWVHFSKNSFVSKVKEVRSFVTSISFFLEQIKRYRRTLDEKRAKLAIIQTNRDREVERLTSAIQSTKMSLNDLGLSKDERKRLERLLNDLEHEREGVIRKFKREIGKWQGQIDKLKTQIANNERKILKAKTSPDYLSSSRIIEIVQKDDDIIYVDKRDQEVLWRELFMYKALNVKNFQKHINLPAVKAHNELTSGVREFFWKLTYRGNPGRTLFVVGIDTNIRRLKNGVRCPRDPKKSFFIDLDHIGARGFKVKPHLFASFLNGTPRYGWNYYFYFLDESSFDYKPAPIKWKFVFDMDINRSACGRGYDISKLRRYSFGAISGL